MGEHGLSQEKHKNETNKTTGLTRRNFPTSSKMSLKTNTFLSPSNQPCFVIRAMSCRTNNSVHTVPRVSMHTVEYNKVQWFTVPRVSVQYKCRVGVVFKKTENGVIEVKDTTSNPESLATKLEQALDACSYQDEHTFCLWILTLRRSQQSATSAGLSRHS